MTLLPVTTRGIDAAGIAADGDPQALVIAGVAEGLSPLECAAAVELFDKHARPPWLVTLSAMPVELGLKLVCPRTNRSIYVAVAAGGDARGFVDRQRIRNRLPIGRSDWAVVVSPYAATNASVIGPESVRQICRRNRPD